MGGPRHRAKVPYRAKRGGEPRHRACATEETLKGEYAYARGEQVIVNVADSSVLGYIPPLSWVWMNP